MTNTHTFENMIVAISRLVKNGEVAATGTLSPIPAAALYLAQMTQAPDMTPMIYGDPDLRITDGLHEFFGLAHRGLIDLFFISGIQIDAQGNFNLSVIGEYEHPKIRLPGGAGSSMLCMMAKRTVAFAVNHDTRLFVPKVDFVNANAQDPSLPWRRGQLDRVVTPLAQMLYDPDIKRIVLEKTMPGVSVEQVVEKTGFDLGIEARQINPVEEPTDQELTTLRGPVLTKLRIVYPNFSDLIWGPAS